MAKTFFSNAKWTKIKNSRDSHAHCDTDEKNKEYAKAICDQLLYRYGAGGKDSPCDIRGYCINTWVTDESGTIFQ